MEQGVAELVETIVGLGFIYFSVERFSIEPQDLRRFRLIPTYLEQNSPDILSLQLGYGVILPEPFFDQVFFSLLELWKRQIIRRDDGALTEDYRPLNNILQFPYVPRP